MSISAVSTSAVSRTKTDSIDQKTVHKKDINRLSNEVKNVIQTSSKMQRILENPKTSSFLKSDYKSSAGKIGLELVAKFREVQAYRAKIEESSYNHAGFKDKTLQKLGDKLGDAMKSLNDVCEKATDAELFSSKKIAMHNETLEHTKLEKQAKAERMKSGADEYNGGFVH